MPANAVELIRSLRLAQTDEDERIYTVYDGSAHNSDTSPPSGDEMKDELSADNSASSPVTEQRNSGPKPKVKLCKGCINTITTSHSKSMYTCMCTPDSNAKRSSIARRLGIARRPKCHRPQSARQAYRPPSSARQLRVRGARRPYSARVRGSLNEHKKALAKKRRPHSAVPLTRKTPAIPAHDTSLEPKPTELEPVAESMLQIELIIEGGNPAASAIVIEANPAHCVQDLKAQIESEVGIPMPQQQLVLRDQILADDAGVLGELVTQAESVQVQVIDTSRIMSESEVTPKQSDAGVTAAQEDEEQISEGEEQISESEQTRRLLEKYRQESQASAHRIRQAQKKARKRKFMRVRLGMNMFSTELKNVNSLNVSLSDTREASELIFADSNSSSLSIREAYKLQCGVYHGNRKKKTHDASSPVQASASQSKRSTTPPQRSKSPPKNTTPPERSNRSRRRSKSSRRRSKSSRRRSKSRQKRSKSPGERSKSPRKRSKSPRKRSKNKKTKSSRRSPNNQRKRSKSPPRESTTPPKMDASMFVSSKPRMSSKVKALNDTRTANFEATDAFAGSMQLFRYANRRQAETGITDKHIIDKITVEHGVKQTRLKKRIFLLSVGEMANVKIWYKEKYGSPWKQKDVLCKVIGVQFTECSVEYEGRPHVENYVSRCAVSKYGGDPLPCFLGPRDPVSGFHDVYYDTPIPLWYKVSEMPSPPINEADYVYVCGEGARVAVRAQSGSVLRCGTVVGHVADFVSTYTIRFDNSTETTNINLCISNATPESTYSYDPGQRLTLFVTALTDWEDVVVVSYQGKRFGSRHVVKTKKGTEMEVDLNRFNHAMQAVKSSDHFCQLRSGFRDHVRQAGRRVVDFITGRQVEVKYQSFNFEILQAGPGTDANTHNNSISINSLAKELAHVAWNRSQGEFSTRPMLLLASAGAGKTWAAHKLQYVMAGIDSPDSLALIIPGNALSNVLRRRSDLTGRDLILTYIRVRYYQTLWYPMLLQSLRMHSMVIIFDGIDEAPEYKEQLLELFTQDLLPKRHRYLLTSRPESLDISQFKSFTILKLAPLTDKQNQFALRQQMGGNDFFEHVLAFRKLRRAQSHLYYEILAPHPSTRRILADLHVRDLFKSADGSGYDPAMRQRTVDGTRFLQIVGDHVTFKSRSIQYFSKCFGELSRSFDRLLQDSDLRKEAYLDIKAWQKHVQQTSPSRFGLPNRETTTEQEINLRVATRLLLYVQRKRKVKDMTNMTALTALMWDDIARHTDELLHVTETFQAPFEHAIRALFASRLGCEIKFEPIIEDPVSLHEKICREYGSRFQDSDVAIPAACATDMLRCSVVVGTVEDVIAAFRTLQRKFKMTFGGKTFSLGLVRVESTFGEFLVTSHSRSMVLGVQLLENHSQAGIFGKVEIQVQGIANKNAFHQSGELYDYFRSFFRCEKRTLNMFLNKLFVLLEKTFVVPIYMALLIVVLYDFDPKSIASLPLTKSELYISAIDILLTRAFGPDLTGLARTVLGRIARWNVLEGRNSRRFKNLDVEKLLMTKVEQKFWVRMVSTGRIDEMALPIIKPLEIGDSEGTYQFKHLSFQEYLAALELVHDFQPADKFGVRPVICSWQEAQVKTAHVLSRPFFCFLVQLYMADKSTRHFWIDPADVSGSCDAAMLSISRASLELRRALVSRSIFPMQGHLNIDNCSWLMDDDMRAWTVRGSSIHTFSAHNCDKITDKGFEYVAVACRDLNTLDLSDCHGLRDAGLIQIVELSNGLTNLTLKGCGDITSEGLKSVGFACQDLLELNLANCKMEHLPDSLAKLRTLKTLNLRWCEDLKDLPNSIGEMKSLTHVNLGCCWNLKALPQAIGDCASLTMINLQRCYNLKSLPESIGNLSKLTTLDLRSCNKLKFLPDRIGECKLLNNLHLEFCARLKTLPRSIGGCSLSVLNITGGFNQAMHGFVKADVFMELESLPDEIGKFTGLRELNLNNCHNLTTLPNGIGDCTSLTSLNLSRCTKFQRLPKSINKLKALVKLNLTSCRSLRFLRISTLPALLTVDLGFCRNLTGLHEDIGQCAQLQTLNLYCCDGLRSLPRNLSKLESLTCLNLSGCNNLACLPNNIGDMEALVNFGLSKGLQVLPETVFSLDIAEFQGDKIDFTDFKALKTLPRTIGALSNLTSLDLTRCFELTCIPDTIGSCWLLSDLKLESCCNIKTLPYAIGGCRKLRNLNIANNFDKMSSVAAKYDIDMLLQHLPKSIKLLNLLTTINLTRCERLHAIPDEIGGCTSLVHLNLYQCSQLRTIPSTISACTALKILDLSNCTCLTELPTTLNFCVSLAKLILFRCTRLRAIPDCITFCASLVEINARRCTALSYLPEKFWNLTKLTHLHLDYCKNIARLPDGIWGCKRLQVLSVSNNPKIRTLPKRLSRCFELVEINLRHCTGLRRIPEGIKEFTARTTVYLEGCTKLHDLSLVGLPCVEWN